MVSRFLITTALEQSWETDKPILFLGQWCKPYNRRDVWQGMDSITADYHWDDRQKLHNDHTMLRGVYEKLLVNAAEKLNELHGCCYSVGFWRIYVGPWLSYFTEVLYDRWYMINEVSKKYSISGSIVINDRKVACPSYDMSDFQDRFVKDDWNHWLIGEVIKRSPLSSIVTFREHGDTNQTDNENTEKRGFDKKLLAKKCLNWMSGILAGRNKVFISHGRLTLADQFKLELSLGQFPSMWYGPNLPDVSCDTELRNSLQLNFADDSEFQLLLQSLIPQQMPRLYLEGFVQHLALINKSGWPENPKIVYTSNSYTSDESFKLYAALKVEKGSRLVIAQHGGSYGVGRFNSSEYHIRKVASIFINWGWGEDPSNGLKALPAINLSACNEIKPNPNGNVLLATMTLPRLSYWLYSIPIGPQHLSYLNDIQTFFKQLQPEIFKASTLRLHPINWEWYERARFSDCLPGISFDHREKDLLTSLSEYRLFIGTYDSTTHLETLSANFPTILFWNPHHWELREEAQAAYDRLKEVGILHDSPQQAAMHVAKVWHNVEAWWYSKEVQEAKHAFCCRYARRDSNGLAHWKAFFRSLLKQ